MTNLSSTRAPASLVLELGRLRWQIELLFRLWKSELAVDVWRTTQPWHILCELYAKLIAMLIQHWLFLVGDVHQLERSLTLACRIIRHFAWQIAPFLHDNCTLEGVLLRLRDALRACLTHSSPTRLTSFKRLFV